MIASSLSSSDWSITVPSEPSSLIVIRQFVERIAAEVAIDGERTFDLKVAVSEACANAVEHSGSESEPLEISAHLESKRLEFVITDNGLFRPPSYAREDFGNRGLGLPLMVTLMDEVNFTKTSGGGTKVTLSLLLG